MTDLHSRIENLSPARRKLLERMSAKKEQRRTYPLSYAQRGMWFLEQLEPNASLYNMPFLFRLSGCLNEQIVEQAVREIIRRHESLRTVYPQRNGVAVQEVLPELPNFMEVVDLTQQGEMQREDELKKLLKQAVLKPFNLAEGPLFRVTLFRLGHSDFVVLFGLHHMVADGWSVGILEQEFTVLYKAFLAGEPSPLPELELQYGDYTLWQRGWLQSGAMHQQLEYWKKQLAEIAEVVLPTDFPRPPMLTHRGRTVEFPFPTDFNVELKKFCRREGITFFMVLLAAFQVALARYLGVQDFAIGTPIANRHRLETEKIIGCFINTLVLRTDLKGPLTFRQLLAKVRDTTLGAFEHQDMPFERLVEELIAVQSLRRTPLFQVLFVVENFPSSGLELPGMMRSHMSHGVDVAKLEMTLTVAERDGACFGSFQYDAELYERTRMQRLMEYFCLVLEQMVSHPEQNIWESPLPKMEREQVLEEWNQTQADYPREKPWHLVVEEQAVRSPQAIAVVVEEQQLSYEELNRRANQVARYLEKLGVGPEITVGLCMERSLEMYVCMLGILKAGGVYVPLDTRYPGERLGWMAQDARLKLILAHDSSMDRVPQSAVCAINMNREWGRISDEPGSYLEVKTQPENLAYIIYTSGSTGQPKGVGISHAAMCNQLCWAVQAFQISGADRFLAKASVSFDSSIEEIFAPLGAGARIVAARPGGEHDIEYLVGLVARQAVTCIDLPPSLLQAMLEFPDATVWESVRLVISGGEALKPEVVRLFREKSHGTLLNTYGPTEATVQSAWAGELKEEESIPIGRAVANTQLFVLDENLEPMPVGASGELYIGGAGLARGYVNRAELTAEKFAPNPFTKRPGERLYRTGDVVKWMKDGQLDFVGRVDQQVKLRGYRIELGEIEKALESHGQVKEAVVTVREDEPGAKRLVAYIVKREEEEELSLTGLREHLRMRLPEYMLPAAWVELKELPSSSNGKIDHKALPKPEGQLISELRVRPRNVREEVLVGLWESVLKQDEVSIEANFFELGGHSLLAMQLVSRIRKAFSIELPLRVLFESPTVASMAEYINQQLQIEPPVETLAMVPVKRDRPLPLSFAQQRLWFLDQLVPESAAYNIPLAVRIAGDLDLEAFRRSWQEIVRRHEALRTTFQVRDGAPVQQIKNVDDWQVEEIDLRDLFFEGAEMDAEVKKWAQAEAQQPFNLSAGPLLRVKLLQLAEQDHVLFVTMHHIVSDGWSVSIMLREFAQLYSAYLMGTDSPLRELELQYADFAVWQREWLQGEILEKQLAYWKNQLADVQPLDLPTRHGRRELTSGAAGNVTWKFPGELSKELKALGRRQGTTLFMTLLAAAQVLLSRYSGQKDVALGTPTAGRRCEETHDLIGFFVNTLVLRTDLSRNPPFAQLMSRVREVTLEAFAHQDVPFEKLVEELQPERDLTRQPFFQAVFALQHAEQHQVQLPGLQLKGLELGENAHPAKFDLMLEVEESDGRIQGSFEYNLDLFDPAMIKTMARHWRLVVEQLVRDPARPLSHISLLTDDERQMCASQWRGPALHEYKHENIAAHVARHSYDNPQAVAIRANDGELSYATLNRRATQWAQYLIAQGVKPGTRVGICLDRGIDWIVAALAVLKSGGVLVTLDSDDPAVRVTTMLANSAAVVVMTTKRLTSLLPNITRFILLDEERPDSVESAHRDADITIQAEAPACIFYRPGAAGSLVGILVPHRTLCGPALSQNLPELEIGESDRVALACGFSQEAASIEIFRTLARGACVVTLPHVSLPPRKLAALLRDQKVTVLWTSGVALESLAREFPWALKTVRRIFCEERAEVLAQLCHKLNRDVLQRVYSVHAYGEAGGCFRVDQLAAASENLMQVEHLAPGTRMYLLEEGKEPAATGVMGEIYIGGDWLALGYNHDSPKDECAFRPDPFNERPASQMYRTGEWARRHPDGNLEYRGRRDRQMTNGGLRIQPEEIEAAVLEHEGVEDAAVVMSDASSPAKAGLAALVVAADGHVISEEDLRRFLLKNLPKAMVPKTIAQVEKITRTPQGKISFEQGIYVAPRTPAEEGIARIWRELLQLERVSVYDDFFKLGGHSLLAVRLKTMLHDRLQWEMPLADLFRAPTIAALAGLMAQAREGSPHSPASSILVEIQAGSPRIPVFFVHPVGGTVLSYVELARQLGPEQPVYAFQSPADGTLLDEVTTMEQMAELYIRMMRTVQPSGPYFLSGWSLGGLVAWEMARQLTDAGEQVELLALIDTYPPEDASAEAQQASDVAMLSLFAQDIAYMIGENLQEQEAAFKQLGSEQQLTLVQDTLARHGLVSTQTAQEETAKLLKVFTRNMRAMEMYKLGKRDQAIMYFAAADSETPDQRAAGWKQWAAGGVDLHLVPSNHYEMIKGPNVEAIARVLNQALSEYPADASSLVGTSGSPG